MGRIRTIKPEFFKNYKLFKAERDSQLPLRVAFSGLWTVCDREGRFKWIPEELKTDILPYDEVDFSRVLDALATRGYIVKYTSGRDDYGFVPGWKTHQFVNGKETASILPIPDETVLNQQVNATVTRSERVNDASTTDGVKERKGKEGSDASRTDGFNSTESAGYCMDAWHVHGIDNRSIIISVLDQLKDKSPMDAAVWLVEERTAYEQSPAYRETEARYRKSIMTWLKDGTWFNWRGKKADKKPVVDGAADWEAEKKRIAEDRRLHPEKYGVPEGGNPCQLN